MLSASVSLWCAVLLILLILPDSMVALGLENPATDFSRHRIVQPKVHHGRTKRQISSTKDTSGAHHSEVEVTVTVDGEEYILELQLNHDLLTDGHTVHYQKDGKTVVYKPRKEEIDFCQYHGTIRGRPSSRVALSTCHGVRGIIFDGEKTRYIEPAEGGEIQSQHYLYDHSDLKTNFHCGNEGRVPSNSTRATRGVNRYKRHVDDMQIRGPYNANKQSRYVELVLVADNSEFKANGGNIRTVHRQLKDLANIVNSVFAPLNIFIALVGVVVWNERDEIQIKHIPVPTLNNFAEYRRTRLLVDIPNDNAQLITRQRFPQRVVGMGTLGGICSRKNSAGLATYHSNVIGLVAGTVAHEMGHNFGMEHDSYDVCECPDKTCIMSSYNAPIMRHWSSCSLQSLALSYMKGKDYCLRNKPKRLFSSPTCGNGFVEPGEQCDCGLALGEGVGDNSACVACCQPDTCMLRSNATCGAGTCCDLQTCRPKSAGTMCRSADRECDLPEYCTGHSEFCPDDVYKMDTTPCGDNEAYCVRGSCRSHTDQCRLLWGTISENSPKCYEHNTKGVLGGNCGYDHLQQRYKPCIASDAECGLLQCRHHSKGPEFDMRLTSPHTQFFSINQVTLTCLSGVTDLDTSDGDPSLVPDGAKCGPDRMCLQQRCVSVAEVRSEIAVRATSVCPSDCNGHGTCNSKGHCHCEAGFAPPLCDSPGVGGSIDSGPATDPTIQRIFMVAMFVIFLGIIPSILLIVFFIYYYRHSLLFAGKTPRKSYVNILLCTGCTGTASKEYFTNKFSRFQSSTSSVRQLLSFKRKNTIKIDNKEPRQEILEITAENSNQPLHYNIVSIPNKHTKKPLNKPPRKINKDDIQIVGGNIPSVIKPKPPCLPPKPKVIIKQGLVSTTNEIVAKGQKSNLYNIGDSELYAKVSKQNVKVHGFKK